MNINNHKHMRFKTFSILFLIPLYIFWPRFSLANDGFGEIGVGGIYLNKTNDISMRSELLDISYSEIQVSYVFENESDKDVTSVISFPLPMYEAFQADSDYKPNLAEGRLPGFSVSVNNLPVQYSTKVQAIKNEKDITEDLHKIGFSDLELMVMPFKITQHFGAEHSDSQVHFYSGIITAQQLKSLKSLGFTLADSEYDIEPDWSIQVTYQWTQTFPAKSKISVFHKYRPFRAYGSDGMYEQGEPRASFLSSKFCIDKKLKSKLDSLMSNESNLNEYGFLDGTIVSYVLKTANTWKNGIDDFTLRIHKGAPTEFVSLCFPSDFKKTDATTLETHLQNFRPESDLNIYFANLSKANRE